MRRLLFRLLFGSDPRCVECGESGTRFTPLTHAGIGVGVIWYCASHHWENDELEWEPERHD